MASQLAMGALIGAGTALLVRLLRLALARQLFNGRPPRGKDLDA
jgi:hypothetical protein